eukprot:gene10165-18833_t
MEFEWNFYRDQDKLVEIPGNIDCLIRMRVLGITWKQKITNVEVEQRIRQLIGNYEPLLVTARRRKLQWFGHITRQNETLAHEIMHGAVESSRGRGRPRNTWLSDIANWTGKSVVSCMRVARDRGRPCQERLGPVEELKDPVEKSNKQMLQAISEILDSKLASLATKDDVRDLKDIINQQRLKIEMLEDKVVLMEKYEQRIEGLEKRASKNNCEIDAASERIEKLELRTDENEQYHRRLCLRINGVELCGENDGESGQECFEKIKDIFKNELKLNIPDMSIDRAHRIGSVTEDPVTGKRYRQIIVRFATWRHRTQVYKAIKASKKLKIRLDLTQKRIKLFIKANGLLEKVDGCFAFADINCRLCLKLNDEYCYFSTEPEFLECIKHI